MNSPAVVHEPSRRVSIRVVCAGGLDDLRRLTARSRQAGVVKNLPGFSPLLGPLDPGGAVKNYPGFSPPSPQLGVSRVALSIQTTSQNKPKTDVQSSI